MIIVLLCCKKKTGANPLFSHFVIIIIIIRAFVRHTMSASELNLRHRMLHAPHYKLSLILNKTAAILPQSGFARAHNQVKPSQDYQDSIYGNSPGC